MRIKNDHLLINICAALFIFFCLTSCSKDAPVSEDASSETDTYVSWQEKLQKCSQESKFACLLVDKSKNSGTKVIRKLLQESVQENPSKIDIIEVDFNKSKDSLDPNYS